MKRRVTGMSWWTVALWLLVLPARGQTFTNLHNFAAAGTNSTTHLLTNIDGAYLYGRMTVSGNTLYGVTSGDNTNGLGGLFKMNTNGTGFTNFFSFSFINNNVLSNGDNGSDPFGSLIVSGNKLYGTTRSGGTNFTGTIFVINTDGSGFQNLYLFSALSKLQPFTNLDGAYPMTGLALYNNALYGTTYSGGTRGLGTVFSIGIDGTGFTNLLNFNGTNGANSSSDLVVANDVIYGTTYTGGMGVNTNGTVFAIHIDGTGYTNLHSFSPVGMIYQTNTDGARPHEGLVLGGNMLYGTTSVGGDASHGYGTVFAINTNGTGFTNIYEFKQTDGWLPYAPLLLSGNVLYGTTTSGGPHYTGTVFQLNTDGSGFSTLTSFNGVSYNGSAYVNNTGAEPWAGVVLAGSALFGVTPSGGAGGAGTIYSVILPQTGTIPLNIQAANGSLTLSWSNPAFILQSAPSLTGSFTNVPNATSPFVVFTTNSQQFYRLTGN